MQEQKVTPSREIQKAERHRGQFAYEEALLVLRKLFPLAFPENGQHVRPLDLKASKIIAKRMCCSKFFVEGILDRWKRRTVYCNAILKYQFRIDLNGMQTTKPISERAKQLAKMQLAKNEATKLRRLQREASDQHMNTVTEHNDIAAC